MFRGTVSPRPLTDILPECPIPLKSNLATVLYGSTSKLFCYFCYVGELNLTYAMLKTAWLTFFLLSYEGSLEIDVCFG